MDYFINTRVGVVHANGCRSLGLSRAENVQRWDPAKAHLSPGVTACPACLTAVPVEADGHRGVTVAKINQLLNIDIWRVSSFRADVRIDFDERGAILNVTLLNPREG